MSTSINVRVFFWQSVSTTNFIVYNVNSTNKLCNNGIYEDDDEPQKGVLFGSTLTGRGIIKAETRPVNVTKHDKEVRACLTSTNMELPLEALERPVDVTYNKCNMRVFIEKEYIVETVNNNEVLMRLWEYIFSLAILKIALTRPTTLVSDTRGLVRGQLANNVTDIK